MPDPYRAIFAAPGAKGFAAAGLIARLTIPIAHMGIITMLSEMRGQYGLAGAVAGAFTLSMALLGPLVSRMVDRLGQGRVLLPVTGVSIAAMGALVLCAHYDAPTWTLFLFAVLAGFTPSMGAMVRARWTELYRGSPKLNTAFSLEAVLDDLTYIVGPGIAVLLGTMLFPQAGPIVAALLLGIGVLAFVPQKRTEPPVRPRVEGSSGSAIRHGTVILLGTVLMFGGAVVGTVDTMGLAFAEDQGQKGLAGLVYGVYALGSAIGGLTFGALRIDVAPSRLLLAGATGTALTTLPFLVVNSVATLSLALFFAGAFFAPTMTVIMGMVERTVPPAQLTEGMTWMLGGLYVGVALGAAVSGLIVDSAGVRAGFGAAIAAGFLTLLLAAAGYRFLRAATTRADAPPTPAEAPEMAA